MCPSLRLEMMNLPADFALGARVRGNEGFILLRPRNWDTSISSLCAVLEIKAGSAFINNGRMHRSRGRTLQTSMSYRMKYASAA